MPDPRAEFPSAADAAKAVDPGDRDGLGVRLDALVDAKIAAEGAATGLRNMSARLDGIADDRGVAPPAVRHHIRVVQSDVGFMADWYRVFAENLSRRIDEVKDEHPDFD